MEQVHGTLNASKYIPKDFISSMPDNVMSNILDRLPIEDAVRTSIFSKDWRFKWTLLTQLVFVRPFYSSLGNSKRINYNGRILSRLLHGLKGSLKKFVLYVNECYSMLDVKNWVILVSENGIEDLRLILDSKSPFEESKTPFELPIQLFSCLTLKHLILYNCSFRHMSSFRGYPNLLSLDLNLVKFESYQCGELLTRCPLLEYLRLTSRVTTDKIKEVEIAILKNLKKLTLDLHKLENMEMITRSTILKLMGFFPKLQKLDLYIVNCKLLSDIEKRPSTTFPCLKDLTLHDIDFSSDVMTSLAIELIGATPNLETLSIYATWKNDVPPPAYYTAELDCIGFGQLSLLSKLKDVFLDSCRGLKNEVCFIKSLLACSPVLEEMSVYSSSIDSNYRERDREQLMFARELLTLPRASPISKIFYQF